MNWYRPCWLLIGLSWLRADEAEASVTWEDQAERLQHVSAALLDNMPMGEMLSGKRHVSLKTNISLLPTMNSTIGAKTEKVPSSPVHAVPTIQQDVLIDAFSSYQVGLRLWGGYLPAGSEKIVNLKAKMTQRTYGAAILQHFVLGSMTPGLEIGYQSSSTRVTGAITAADAQDTFVVKSQLTYASLGLRSESLGVWSSLLCASRNIQSEFSIPSDSTSLTLSDNKSQAAQIAGGWEHSSGVNLGIAQLYIPKRLTMTRVLMGIKINW